jgi:cytoskeletal protein CcmA (bactofilin family)
VGTFWNKKGEESGNFAAESKSNLQGSTAAAPAPAAEAGQTAPQSAFADLVTRKGSAVVSNHAEQLAKRFGSVRAVLGPGTVIEGKLSFDNHVRIDGQLRGEIFSSKALIVGPGGNVDARIEVAALIVLGEVRGSILAHDRVEVYAPARLGGEVRTPVFVVEEGAVFNGKCQMGEVPASDGADSVD